MRMLEHMSNERDRVISITLSEAEWQAFVARQPQPVDWLRQQIRSHVEVAPPRTDTHPAVQA
jgi:ribosomal protein L31E